MVIREAVGDDVDAIAALVVQLDATQVGRFDPGRVRQGHRTFVAEVDAQVVGFAFGTFVDLGLPHESSGTLEQVVVDAGHRGRGLGEALVEEWKAWLRAEGVPLGFVSTTAELGAAGFYERCGFRACTGPWLVWSEL